MTGRFGDVLRVPYVAGMDSHPDIIAVLKQADEKRISTFGGTWHTDFSFLPEPPDATLLQAVELPPVGGDTIWANQYLAYESLSPGLQRLLDPAARGPYRLAPWHDGPRPRRRGQQIDQDDAQRSQRRPGSAASGRARPSGDAAQGAVRQPGLYPALCRHDRRRNRSRSSISCISIARGRNSSAACDGRTACW